MKLRSGLHLALASTVLMGAAIAACSAPDPGQVVYTQRLSNNNGVPVGGGNDAGGGGGGGGGTDAGGGGADSGSGGTGAFAGAPAYMKGTASQTAKGQSGHTAAGKFGPGNDPTGVDCLQSGCHITGGAGTPWGFAGTAYSSPTQTAPAGVEVRVIDSTGKALPSVYTDANGNFWSQDKFPTTAATAGARDGTKSYTMKTSAPAGCNASGCHASGANPMFP